MNPDVALKTAEDRIKKLEKNLGVKEKLIVSNTKEIAKLKLEIKRLITRMNTNEADVRYLNTKR